MALFRVKARWTIPGAGTAFSVLHFDDGEVGQDVDQAATNQVNALHTFFDSVKNVLPSVVKVQVLGDVEVIDVATGELVGAANGGSKAELAGAQPSSIGWAAPTGACITWTTAGIRQVSSKPRRVRGRTFIVPLSNAAYDVNGTLTDTAMGTLNAAATALRGNFSGQELAVFARPGVGGTPVGAAYAVTGHKLTDQAAILRSRRS
jgi:hypothetical protein